MHKEKFMIYRRDAKKGEATYYAQGEIHDLSEGCEEGRGHLFAEVALCPTFRRPLRRGHGRMDIVVLLQQEG